MIKYGIDSFVLTAPWSIIVSILMFSGTTVVGIVICKYSKLNFLIKQISNVHFQYPIFGFLVLILILYPLVLFKIINSDFIKIFSILIISLNFYYLFFYSSFINLYRFQRNQSSLLDFYLIVLIIFGYFILSLGPITSADSLDYHSATAIHILNYGEYPSKYYWFHSRIAGSGEVLIALGLAIGAEQYGSLVQFSGLLSIVGLLNNFSKKNNIKDETVLIFILLFLIIPIHIFLNTTNKPQLMPIALTSICFVLSFLKLDSFKHNIKIHTYSLVIILLIAAHHLKYSFVLSGAIIGFCCLIKTINKKNYIKILFITIVVLILFFTPYTIWKYINFEQNILYSLFLALPQHLYGYDSLMESISSCGYSCFPTWFFIPRSVNEATNFFGILFFFIFFIRIKDKKQFLIFISIIFYFVIGLTFGQSNPRFFFEPAIWFIFLLILSWKYDDLKIYKFFYRYLIRLQALFIIIIIFFGVFTLLPGSLSNDLREQTLIKKANGYSLLNWASKNLDDDDVLLSTHRSVAIPRVKTVPGFLLNYINPRDIKSKIYYEEIKKEKPNYIIITENLKRYKDIFNSCLGELVYFKKNIHVIATRNPFSKGNVHNGYIYKFNSERLPYCIIKEN